MLIHPEGIDADGVDGSFLRIPVVRAHQECATRNPRHVLDWPCAHLAFRLASRSSLAPGSRRARIAPGNRLVLCRALTSLPDPVRRAAAAYSVNSICRRIARGIEGAIGSGHVCGRCAGVSLVAVFAKILVLVSRSAPMSRPASRRLTWEEPVLLISEAGAAVLQDPGTQPARRTPWRTSRPPCSLGPADPGSGLRRRRPVRRQEPGRQVPADRAAAPARRRPERPDRPHRRRRLRRRPARSADRARRPRSRRSRRTR